MTAFARLAVICLVACASAQYAEERAPRYIASSAEPKNTPTPVPILKQINRHNEDGSYTYGYEGADGSFKIETKSAGGEVKGKYGYKDDTGKLRVIEYGANKYGFQPAGEGITVAPPTLVDESTREPNKQGGRYRQQDYNDYDEPAPTPAPRPRPTPQPQQYRPAPQPQYRPAPTPQPQYRPAPTPQPQYRPAPTQQPQYRPAPTQQPQQQYNPNPQTQYRAPQSAPTPPKPQFFAGAAPAPVQDNFFNPEPAPRQYKPKQDFRPVPDYQDFSPQAQAPRFTPNQYQQPRSTQTFSMLDQLLKEYSLPSGGSAPTHDITFGSY